MIKEYMDTINKMLLKNSRKKIALKVALKNSLTLLERQDFVYGSQFSTWFPTKSATKTVCIIKKYV